MTILRSLTDSTSHPAADDTPMAQEPTVIALVHGTWAKESVWTAAGSPLRRGLEERLAGPVHFHVCHSHGGNIGVRAAVELQDMLSGVVCLNTPFIAVTRQNVVWRLATFSLVLIVTPLAFLAASLDTLAPDLRFWYRALLLAVGVAAFALGGGFLSVINQRIKAMAEDVVARSMPGRITRCPLLCVSSAGDEATYGLGLLEVLANLPAFLQHIFVLPALFVIAVMAQLLGWASPLRIGALEFNLIASAWAITLVAFIGLQILGRASSLTLRTLPLGLGIGLRAALTNLAVRVVVTPVPLNARVVDFVDVDTTGGSLLAHSRIYDDPAVIALVARWIAGIDAPAASRGAVATAPAVPTEPP